MKILVLSDSHSGMHFMRACIARVKPDQVIHLGDYFDDAQAIAEEYPHLVVHQVPGNCDRYRTPLWAKEILVTNIGGARFYLTHGHRHNVKLTTSRLLADAKAAQVQAVLYGHTHIAECYQQEDGLWVMNPGACGSTGGSAGLIVVEDKQITQCRIIRLADLEEMK